MGVIEQVACKPVYGPLLRDLGDIGSGLYGAPKAELVPFFYDWRGDLRGAAGELADILDGEVVEGRSDLILIAHSMGGLVARWFLESGVFDDRPGWASVQRLITVATPHGGAPAALVRALGLEATVGLAGADVRRLAGDPHFPALY